MRSYWIPAPVCFRIHKGNLQRFCAPGERVGVAVVARERPADVGALCGALSTTSREGCR